MANFFLYLTLIYILSLNANVQPACIITEDVKEIKQQYTNCTRRCHWMTRIIKIGPLVYLCSDTDIREVNSKVKSNVENLLFINNSYIPILEPKELSWVNVTELHMQNTHTSKIVPGFFTKFDQLKTLEITNNLLTDIIDGSFSSLPLLATVNLSKNSLAEIRQHIFSGLRKLKILDLSQNKISSISPDAFEYQEVLEYVDISQNLLKHVDSVFTLHSIQTVDLSKNQLKDFNFLDLKYDQSPYLKKVDLSDNFIGNLTNINKVCADSFILSQNNISILENMKCIKNVNLSHNHIQVVGKQVFDSDLEILDLSNNNISDMHPSTFENAIHLIFLYLEHNNLKSIPTESLLKPERLKEIDLSYNNISEIPFGLFNNLDDLIYLDLSHNNMVLDLDALSTLKSLKYLNFQNNTIKNFNVITLVYRFKNLKFLILPDNLMNCNELADTIHLLQLEDVTFSKGINTQSSNILGISCKDNPNLKEESLEFERKLSDPLQNNTIDKNQDTLSHNLSDVDRTASIGYLNNNFTEILRILSDGLRNQTSLYHIIFISNVLLFCILCIMIGALYLYYRSWKLKYFKSIQEQVQLL